MDATAERLIAFLRSSGAAEHPHAGGRSLLEHLVDTYAIVRRWGQPLWLQHAALIHSAYGTDVHRRSLITWARRPELVAIAGERAERIAYLFCVTPRRPLFAGTYRWAPPAPAGWSEGEPPPSRDELDAVLLLHMANLAEQVRAGDGSPGPWLVRLRELAEWLVDSDAVALPLFVAELAAMSEADERLCRRAYRSALADPEHGGDAAALSAAVCPVVAEPCVWQAYRAWRIGQRQLASEWASTARRRLRALGTAWDKRLSFDQWLELTERLERAVTTSAPSHDPATDPRALFQIVCGGHPHQEGGSSAAPRRPDAAEGRMRFQRYVETLADGDRAALGGLYPGLESQPWFDPAAFPLARHLETHFAEIASEVLALAPSRFHRESEPISRSGDWDVVFFYERGRRHDDACAACPVTTRAIEGEGAMRTAAGLIYVSRMRGQTHIAPHRGPTNLRLRCHLPVRVPAGDCGLRVGNETRTWTEGECLVFDDHFEHEAWNHTDEDRIVLIVDLWHPGLTPSEVELLAGLHGYGYAYARRLSRYWSANAAAAADAGQP